MRPDQRGAIDAQEAVQESEVGIATASDGQELILVIATEGSTHLRRVPAATGLDPRLPQGTAAEEAVATSAALWGLPDFVFPLGYRRHSPPARRIADPELLPPWPALGHHRTGHLRRQCPNGA